MINYDQWKTASPHDQQEEIVEFTGELERTGRVGHGLCGKDADLDPGGQIKVKGTFLILDHKPPYAVIRLSVYANICRPEDEEQAEIADELVFDENSYPGEWTGSDYWCFSLQEEGYEMKVEYPHIDPIETEPEDINKEELAMFANKAIFSDPKIKAFQDCMSNLSKAIDN
jgi:hypothetical protein